MQANPFIEDQLTKLRARHEAKKKILDAQTKKWQRALRALGAGLIVARIVAASGCIVPSLMFLFAASYDRIGIAATIVSFVFLAVLLACGVLHALSRLCERKKSDMENAYTETADMVAFMESLTKGRDGV